MKTVNVPQEESKQFAGCWVAVKSKRIVAVAQKREGLKDLTVGTKANPPEAYAMYIPKPGEMYLTVKK